MWLSNNTLRFDCFHACSSLSLLKMSVCDEWKMNIYMYLPLQLGLCLLYACNYDISCYPYLTHTLLSLVITISIPKSQPQVPYSEPQVCQATHSKEFLFSAAALHGFCLAHCSPPLNNQVKPFNRLWTAGHARLIVYFACTSTLFW